MQGLSSVSVALVVGLMASWKLTLVISCFTPLMIMSNKMQRKTHERIRKVNDHSSSYDSDAQVDSLSTIEYIN